MALESFYGGKPGYSPVIKGTFKYISENDSRYKSAKEGKSSVELAELNKQVMNLCFKDPTYTDIWYGELCIISSDSMYDSNNGKIFRRTLKKQSSLDETYGSLYAEYLGQIVGMPGGLPRVAFNTIDNIQQQAENNNSHDVWYPIIDNEGIVGTGNTKGQTPAVLNSSKGIAFVPGATKVGNTLTFTDDMEYTWLQVLDPQPNEDELNNTEVESDGTAGTLNIGLKIPYLYLDTPQVNSVPYTNAPNVLETDEDENHNHHNFYKKYIFEIPDGTPGISVQNLRLTNKQILDNNNIINVYNPINISFDWDSEDKIIKIDVRNASYDLTNYNNNKYFWVYDLIVPNKTQAPFFTTYTCFAGNYDEINNVNLDGTTGRLTFETTYGRNITTTNGIKFITGTEIETDLTDPNYGNFTVNYNDNNNSDVYKLPLLKNISIFTDNKKEKVKIELADSNDSSRELTLKRAGSNDDYILKYPAAVRIRNGTNEDNNLIANPEDYKFLSIEYNNGDIDNLGAIGLTNVENINSSIGLGKYNNSNEIEIDTTNYKITSISNDAFLLVKEDILLNNTIDEIFPSFSIIS